MFTWRLGRASAFAAAVQIKSRAVISPADEIPGGYQRCNFSGPGRGSRSPARGRLRSPPRCHPRTRSKPDRDPIEACEKRETRSKPDCPIDFLILPLYNYSCGYGRRSRLHGYSLLRGCSLLRGRSLLRGHSLLRRRSFSRPPVFTGPAGGGIVPQSNLKIV